MLQKEKVPMAPRIAQPVGVLRPWFCHATKLGCEMLALTPLSIVLGSRLRFEITHGGQGPTTHIDCLVRHEPLGFADLTHEEAADLSSQLAP